MAIAELRSDSADLETVEARNKQAADRVATGTREELDWSAFAYTIHNIYGMIERYCLRVAKLFENNVERISWHHELLQRMRLDIEGVRSALFDKETALQAANCSASRLSCGRRMHERRI